VDERLPDQSQQTALRSLGDERLAAIVDGYVDAWERDDVDAVVAMLAEDARLAMPPVPTWYSGREAVAAFLRRLPLAGNWSWRVVPTSANGQLAFGQYVWDEDKGAFVPHEVTVLTLGGERIQEITVFLADDVFPRFGLPEQIKPTATRHGLESRSAPTAT
jgi:RNA polymerase sigma-70 factor, ECF subfamily